MTIRFDLGHDLDLWILKVKCDLDLWPHTWPWPWIFMDKFGNTCISEWEGRLTLHKGVGSRSFMTMTMTIWWPRSGAWIYQVVTGVTSVVGVPSTHLVYLASGSLPVWHYLKCCLILPHFHQWGYLYNLKNDNIFNRLHWINCSDMYQEISHDTCISVITCSPDS